MDQSVRSQILPLIRRRLLPLWLAATWPFALEACCMVSISFAMHARVVSGQLGSPLEIWQSMSSLNRLAISLAFIVWIFLPLDLGAVGVAMIVRSYQQGKDLDLKSFVSRYARIVWLVVPISIGLGILIYLGSLFFLFPGIFLAIWRAFVMPALATAQDNLGRAVRHSFRLSLRRLGSLLGLALATIIAQIPALLALFVPNVVVAERGPYWWVGRLVGWVLFTGLMGLIFMTRSVVLALLYLDAVRSDACSHATLAMTSNARAEESKFDN